MFLKLNFTSKYIWGKISFSQESHCALTPMSLLVFSAPMTSWIIIGCSTVVVGYPGCYEKEVLSAGGDSPLSSLLRLSVLPICSPPGSIASAVIQFRRFQFWCLPCSVNLPSPVILWPHSATTVERCSTQFFVSSASMMFTREDMLCYTYW